MCGCIYVSLLKTKACMWRRTGHDPVSASVLCVKHIQMGVKEKSRPGEREEEQDQAHGAQSRTWHMVPTLTIPHVLGT